MAILKANEYIGGNLVAELTQLAAASTRSDVIDLRTDNGQSVYTNVLFTGTVASMTTDVRVCLQGSLDNVNWFNLDADEGLEIYTADGTYAIRYDGDGEVLFIAYYFHTETGGTDATIDVKAKIFGKPVNPA